MYIKRSHRYYDNGGRQAVRRAEFMLLLQLRDSPRGASNVYACVRRVALRQLGQFMMGSANIGGAWYVVSGAYGSDGFPLTVDKLPKDAKPLPKELYDAWSDGGGWNSAGDEAPAMRDWALVNLI